MTAGHLCRYCGGRGLRVAASRKGAVRGSSSKGDGGGAVRGQVRVVEDEACAPELEPASLAAIANRTEWRGMTWFMTGWTKQQVPLSPTQSPSEGCTSLAPLHDGPPGGLMFLSASVKSTSDADEHNAAQFYGGIAYITPVLLNLHTANLTCHKEWRCACHSRT